ncbi:DUF3892 domain-containing protein [Nakamurella endophytica]|uniref:DUF3892 domain-containing protein n=1 Tax=Nakamurella endophytica TaxID=1748367 RepID=A0A917T9R5_9ACTN|nr:hypothetical protein GCM10011594_39670 [Nakamurella endophytica]
MTECQVTHVTRDQWGRTLELRNDAIPWRRSAAACIYDIETGLNSYYVLWREVGRTDIHVVNGPTGKYLRTDHDSSQRNNLDDLPS